MNDANPNPTTIRPIRVPVSKRLLDLVVTVPLLVVLSPLLALIAVAIKVDEPGPGPVPPDAHRARQQAVRDVEVPLDGGERARERRGAAPGVPRGARRHARDGSRQLQAQRRPARHEGREAAAREQPRRDHAAVQRREGRDVARRARDPRSTGKHEMFDPEFQRRTDVLPGITGLWQVSGRSLLSTPDMLKFDMEYIDRRTIWLDIQILCKTLPTVIRGDGAR